MSMSRETPASKLVATLPHPFAKAARGVTRRSVASTSLTDVVRSLLDTLGSTGRFVVTIIAVGLSSLAIGMIVGRLLHDPRATAQAHASGACIALELAAAHGAIGEMERRMTIRALATVLNPHFDRFPDTQEAISGECAQFAKASAARRPNQ